MSPSHNTLPPPVGKLCPKNPPPTPFNFKDSLLLSPRSRNHPQNPAPGLQIKIQSRMAFHQPDDQFTGSLNNPTRNVDERKPNRLYAPGCPGTSQNLTLHDCVYVHRSSSRAPFGAQPSQIRTCPIKASGSSYHGFAALQ